MIDLDAAAIAARLRALDHRAPVTVAAITGSTNDDARAAAIAGAQHGAAFLADAQRRGRGRGGHAWHSPPGENLYLSIVLRPADIAPREIAPLTLAIGVAVARAIEARFPEGSRASIKWPNDVLVDGRKIAGVLVESALRAGAITAVVAGVGVNVKTLTFPADLADRATSLALLGARSLDRSALAAALIAGITRAADRFAAERLAPFLDDLRARDHLLGQPVTAIEARGIGAGVRDDGAYVIEVDGGARVPITSGAIEAP